MDDHLLQFIFAPFLAVGGWIMKRLHARVDIIEQNYVNKQDMRDMREEMRDGFKGINDDIKRGLERIYDKLDSKVDK